MSDLSQVPVKIQSSKIQPISATQHIDPDLTVVDTPDDLTSGVDHPMNFPEQVRWGV